MALYSPPVSARNVTEYQTIMSNTAHQREVMDLKAAGLNPILSAHGSGASTPQGDASDFAGAVQSLASSAASSAHALNNAVSSMGKALDNTTKKINNLPVAVTDSGTGTAIPSDPGLISNWMTSSGQSLLRRGGLLPALVGGALTSLAPYVDNTGGFSSARTASQQAAAFRRLQANQNANRAYARGSSQPSNPWNWG